MFRNLVVDETAGESDDGNNQGYGIRIQSCTDVVVEDCEAYRCGRHNIGVINATGFIGRRIIGAYAAPNYPGANTIFVSYAGAGAPVAKCEHQWIDCVSDHAENGGGGLYDAFTTHGSNQGKITFENFQANSKVSFMAAPVVMMGGVISGTGSIENWGDGVLIDGVTLKDSAAIDQYGSDGIIQNCVADLNPSGGGPTGYGSAVLIRDNPPGSGLPSCGISSALTRSLPRGSKASC